MTDLFSPLSMGPLELPNRICMAPLTRNRAALPGCKPQAMNVKYYTQRASAGLIITEATQICPEGVGYPATPGIHSAEQVAGWLQVTDAVHAVDGRIFLQLWHVGRISHPSLQPNGALPVAPSAIKPAGEAVTYEGMQGFVTPRALELGEIPGIVAAYEVAARHALEAGFDGVEVHSANGYLLDQFLRDGTNKRTDAYGGSVENRSRLLVEVVEAVSSVWGGDRVGVRLSPVNTFNDMGDSDPDTTFQYAARAISRFGLAYLHVVEGAIGDPSPPSYDTQALRRAFDGLYMANGGYDFARATEAVRTGAADLVSFGVPYIANPDLVERFRWGAALNAADENTFYGGDEKGYTDYPVLEV
jgi:N-ethylmaleimide reductase